MVELKPMNKNVVIQAIKTDEKVGGGLLYAPANALERQHKTGKIIAFAPCEETRELKTGDVVLYDSIGSVDHRVGNQMFTTVKALNIIAVVRDVSAEETELNKAIVETHG
jgi:co-chaperonin GroES (HSP10)